MPVTEITVSSARATWCRVFATCDPFVDPFAEPVADAVLIYPTKVYCLTEQQYTAIQAAIEAIGDDAFYFSYCEGDRTFDQTRHLRCERATYQEYQNVATLMLEHALYGPDASWGLLISHEEHAIMGGTGAFISTFIREYGSPAKDLQKLQSAWAGNPNGQWLTDLLKSPRVRKS